MPDHLNGRAPAFFGFPARWNWLFISPKLPAEFLEPQSPMGDARQLER